MWCAGGCGHARKRERQRATIMCMSLKIPAPQRLGRAVHTYWNTAAHKMSLENKFNKNKYLCNPPPGAGLNAQAFTCSTAVPHSTLCNGCVATCCRPPRAAVVGQSNVTSGRSTDCAPGVNEEPQDSVYVTTGEIGATSSKLTSQTLTPRSCAGRGQLLFFFGL